MYTEWFLTSSFVTELLVNCLITQFSGRFWAFPHTTCPHRTWSPEHSKTIEPVQKYSIFGHSEAIICGGLQDASSTWHTSTAFLELSDRRKRVVTSAYPVHLCLICFRNGRLQAKLHLGPTFAASCQEILPISLSVLQLLQSTLLTMKPGPWFCLCQTLEQTEECEAGISWSHTHYNCKAKSLAQGLKKSLASLRQWEAESRTCPLQFAIPGLLRQIQLLCRRIAISKA